MWWMVRDKFFLFLPQVMAKYDLGMYHRPMWKKIKDLLQPLLPILLLSPDGRLANWKLYPKGLNMRPVSICKLTSMTTYRLLQPMPWIHNHGNHLWHMQKPLSWWSKNLITLWKAKLPLKQRLYLWWCINGTLPVETTLVKRKIATTTATCLRCHASVETVPHLLWFCHCSRLLTRKISRFLCLHSQTPGLGNFFAFLADVPFH